MCSCIHALAYVLLHMCSCICALAYVLLPMRLVGASCPCVLLVRLTHASCWFVLPMRLVGSSCSCVQEIALTNKEPPVTKDGEEGVDYNSI
jgi:hypothetical protein